MNKKTITIFRKTHNLTQKELGELLGGVTKVSVSAYETGHLPIPKWFRVRFEKAIEDYGIDWNIDIPHDKPLRIRRATGKRTPEVVAEQAPVEHAQAEGTPEVVEVEQPPHAEHYTQGKENPIDVIKFAEENFSPLERIGFYRVSAIKYLTRYGKKSGYNNADLEKAMFFIKKLQKEGESLWFGL